jgi:hypothetical protein
MNEQWMSIVEYARTFGISDMTIRRRIKTGRIDAVLRDGKYFIPVQYDPVTNEPMKASRAAATNQTVNNPYAIVKPRPVMQPAPQERFSISAEPEVVSRSVERTAERAAEPTRHTFRIPEVTVPAPAPVQASAPTTAQYSLPNTIHSPMVSYENIPTNLVAPLLQHGQALIETKALLEYCNNVLKKSKDMELEFEQKHEAKMAAVEERVKGKDIQILQLKQQVEDLQLLVQIMEKRRA